MKQFLITSLLFLLAAAGQAQYSWNILLHKKILLSGKEVDADHNTKLIRSTDWKKTGKLEVHFKEEQPSNWNHSIRFTDENENMLLSKDSSMSTSVSTSQLRKIFAGKKQIKIFMVINPPDPLMAAPSRMLHLATLKLP